jgi:hypothetical protein
MVTQRPSGSVLLSGDDTATEASPTPPATVESPTPNADTGANGDTAATVVTVRAPQNLQIGAVGTDEVRLLWERAPFGATVDHFLVVRDGEVIAESDERSYADATVEPGTTYVYRIVAVGADGSRATSKDLRVTTPALPTTPPPDTSGGEGTPPEPSPTCSAIDHFEGEC